MKPSLFRLFRRSLVVSCGAVAGLLFAASANAQQRAFHLDRLEVPGSSEDGAVLFRPTTEVRSVLFGQIGMGYSRRPLHTTNITNDRATLRDSSGGVVQNQLNVYATAGFHLFDRVILSVNLPFAPLQTGDFPAYSATINSSPNRTAFTTDGPSASDLRLDGRFILFRSTDRRTALGAAAHVFAPTGSSNFGGDGRASLMTMVHAETQISPIILTANTGIHFRPHNVINDPANTFGLGIGNEWRWAVGAFWPFKGGKYRLGATIFGQTGLEDNATVGNTLFKKQNSPVEWSVEGRMKLGPSDRWWLGASGGSMILNGYGAPDVRILALFGVSVPLNNSDATQRDPKLELREKWKKERSTVDTDGDGIVDDLDACPNEPEDHQGADPNDGCPVAKNDRDGDGILDAQDKCPDTPEDKDGIDDFDGCPEDDADKDGIGDAEDACPHEPGKKSPEPGRNGCPEFIQREGDSIRIFQQVHFQTGSATILPDSFPLLQELTNLLKANPSIKRMSVEGHTDNRGGAAMNKTLSQNRANSVMQWIVQHGIEPARLEAHGFGLEKPVGENTTEEGRSKNRRVEFKILKEE